MNLRTALPEINDNQAKMLARFIEEKCLVAQLLELQKVRRIKEFKYHPYVIERIAELEAQLVKVMS